MKFEKIELQQTLWGDSEVLETVQDEMAGTTRWSSLHELVFRDTRSGKLYHTSYRRGLTEQQDERPFEYEPDEIECPEVEAYERTVTAYRKVTT